MADKRCEKHPGWSADECVWCGHARESVHVTTNDWCRGIWEHIDPKNPHLKIDSKEHLIRECEKHGVMPRALMKHKSQGKGYEIRRRIA